MIQWFVFSSHSAKSLFLWSRLLLFLCIQKRLLKSSLFWRQPKVVNFGINVQRYIDLFYCSHSTIFARKSTKSGRQETIVEMHVAIYARFFHLSNSRFLRGSIELSPPFVNYSIRIDDSVHIEKFTKGGSDYKCLY